MPNLKSLQKRYYAILPSGELDILLAHAIKRDKAFLYSHPDYRLSYISYLIFLYRVWQRRRGLPIAYITHHKEFYGLDFYVNKHTLIPRPETELMVDVVLRALTTTPYSLQPTYLIDIGTGSGCIPIAAAKSLDKEIKIFATDISASALQVARKNARTQNVSIDFLHGNLLEPFEKIFSLSAQGGSALGGQSSVFNIIITANLPYLTQTQFDREPSIQHEPHSALVATSDGLELYKQLLSQISSLLLPTPYSLLLFLEIDPAQSSDITALVHLHLPSTQVEIKLDLAGHDRLVAIKLDKMA